MKDPMGSVLKWSLLRAQKATCKWKKIHIFLFHQIRDTLNEITIERHALEWNILFLNEVVRTHSTHFSWGGSNFLSGWFFASTLKRDSIHESVKTWQFTKWQIYFILEPNFKVASLYLKLSNIALTISDPFPLLNSFSDIRVSKSRYCVI